MFGLSIGNCEGVHIITNGSNTQISLALLRMSKKMEDVFGIELSQDIYHDEIDDRVVEAFTKEKRIRNTEDRISNHGRAKDNDIASLYDECICEDLIIKPSGEIHFCGCANSPAVGNVLLGQSPSEYYMDIRQESECWTRYQEEQEKLISVQLG